LFAIGSSLEEAVKNIELWGWRTEPRHEKPGRRHAFSVRESPLMSGTPVLELREIQKHSDEEELGIAMTGGRRREAAAA
jgi:hypothetical protein